MVNAFVAYVRFEEKLLLLRRNKQDPDFAALWDGVWGVGDTPCLLYTSPSPRDKRQSRMPSSA